MKLSLLVGTAAVAALAATNTLAAENGWYGAVDIGAHEARPFETHSDDLSISSFRFNSNTNVVVFGRVGYQIIPHLRLEIEGGYRPGSINNFRSRSGNPIVPCASGTGPVD